MRVVDWGRGRVYTECELGEESEIGRGVLFFRLRFVDRGKGL